MIRFLPSILILAAVACVPSVAHAAEVTSEPSVPGYLAQWLLATVGPIVVALAGWALAELVRWLRAQTTNARYLAALDRAAVAVAMAVGKTSQTFVDAIKVASEDGTLTLTEAKEARDRTLADARLLLGPPGLELVRKVLGGPDDDALDKWLIALIESKIAAAKRAK